VALILTKAYENKKPITLPDDGRPQWTAVDIEMPATALASGDLILAATIPIGFEVIDYFITSPDCDSGGSALAVSIGVALADLSDLGTGTKVWGTSITAFATGVPFRNALNACQADPKDHESRRRHQVHDHCHDLRRQWQDRQADAVAAGLIPCASRTEKRRTFNRMRRFCPSPDHSDPP